MTQLLAALLASVSQGQRDEMLDVGIIDTRGVLLPPHHPLLDDCRQVVRVQQVSADAVLNEAFHYTPLASTFSRAVTFTIANVMVLLISGTASVDAQGKTAHAGDFGAQCWRTFRNIKELLDANGMTWHHVVRTSCYLRDIERDYATFNRARTQFYNWMGLHPYPASTGVQAILCRPELLVEIEAIACCKLVGGG